MGERRAIVTGASQGLGREFAERLAERGFVLTLVGRDTKALARALEALGGTGHAYLGLDLSTEAGLEALAQELRHGQYDLLVNNAGAGLYGPFESCDVHEAQRMVRLNCEAVVALSHAFLRTAQPGAALINVSGILGTVPFPGYSAYAATKAFVLSFSEALSHEQRARGIYVMGLCPGPLATEFVKRAGGGAPLSLPPPAFVQAPERVVARALLELERRQRANVHASKLAARIGFWLMSLLPRRMFFARAWPHAAGRLR